MKKDSTESRNIRFEKESKALKKNLEKRKKQESELAKLKSESVSSQSNTNEKDL